MRTISIALRWPLLCTLAVVLAGCRTDPNQALLIQESRRQEDYIWYLESMLEECCDARGSTMRENEALKREAAGGDRGAEPAPRSSILPKPSTRPPRESTTVPDAPKIELPGSSGEAPPFGSGASNARRYSDAPPSQLVINPRLTGGMDRDGRDGDEGILVAFEPLDPSGRLSTWTGAVSIVLMDPAIPGDNARVARWDFTPDEVAHKYQSTMLAQGLQFELPWPNRPPEHRDLQLFVRYTTPDGQKLNADAKIDVNSPLALGQPNREAQNWWPTDSNNTTGNSRPAARGPNSRLLQGGPAMPDAESAEPIPPGRTSQRPPREPVREAKAERPEWTPFR